MMMAAGGPGRLPESVRALLQVRGNEWIVAETESPPDDRESGIADGARLAARFGVRAGRSFMRTPSRRVPQPARWHFLDRFIAVKSAATVSSNLESSTNAVMGEERLGRITARLAKWKELCHDSCSSRARRNDDFTFSASCRLGRTHSLGSDRGGHGNRGCGGAQRALAFSIAPGLN